MTKHRSSVAVRPQTAAGQGAPGLRAPTRVAAGAIPPPPGATASVPPPTSTASTPTARLTRDARVGTQLRGTEGLSAPGGEASAVRLTLGKPIPGTRYKIIRWLGEGGMGVVYEAEHVDIERRVALKILRFDLSQQPTMAKVFKDEARAAGRLGSQYLVELFDFGELSDGRLFFVMELLEGRDLVPPDTQSSMDPSKLIPIVRQMCKGLHVAHEAGVVHRDIKPENVLSTRAPDGREQVKIVDFGISSMLAAGPQSGGGIAGTPHYMAPELIMGKAFDGRLDIYALGCMTYELLTGKPPFEAKTMDSLLEKQVHEAPAPIRDRRPELDVHPELEAVVLRCLEKDPRGRYRTTAELEAAICEAQIAAGITTEWDDLPVPELPEDPERQAAIAAKMPSRLPGRRSRGWAWPAVAGIASLVAVALAAYLTVGRRPTVAEVNDVDRLTAEARSAASRANWVVPPADAPEDSAFANVLALEELPGRAEALGDARGGELRTEFSGTLIKQADELWTAGAEELARYYYFQSLVFDDANRYAFERSGTTPSMLAGYLDRIRDGNFSELDRAFSALASAEISQDPEVKEERLAAAEAALDADASASLVLAQSPTSRRLLSRRRRKPAPPSADLEPSVAPPADDPPAAEPDAVPQPPLDSGATPPEETRKARRRRRASVPSELLGRAERDPVAAARLAEEGLAALRAGRRAEAASLFNQAISHNRKNATALMGLSDVYFDTGRSQKAVEYAERGVRASPSHAEYRLKLGDAYFRVLRYKDALEQYEKAAKRGSPRASARIAKVKTKLGA